MSFLKYLNPLFWIKMGIYFIGILIFIQLSIMCIDRTVGWKKELLPVRDFGKNVINYSVSFLVPHVQRASAFVEKRTKPLNTNNAHKNNRKEQANGEVFFLNAAYQMKGATMLVGYSAAFLFVVVVLYKVYRWWYPVAS